MNSSTGLEHRGGGTTCAIMILAPLSQETCLVCLF
jgi:hypothetical protein